MTFREHGTRDASDVTSRISVLDLTRFTVPAGLWLLRIILPLLTQDPRSGIWLVATDVAIVGTHVWATYPLRRAVGSAYGRRPSWTFLVEIFLVLGIFLSVRDASRLF